jgi:hypothetical protein
LLEIAVSLAADVERDPPLRHIVMTALRKLVDRRPGAMLTIGKINSTDQNVSH